MDYSTYLNGAAKEELDQLKKMAGHFKIQSCELSIEGDEKPALDDWEQVKEYLKENLQDEEAGGLVNFMDDTGDLSIYEKEDNGRRFWLVSDVDGMKKHLLSNTSSWEETYSERTHQQDFIEDGKLVHTTKIAVLNNEGKMELVFDLYVSFTVDKQGNVIRELIYSFPDKNIKITLVMWSLRCVCDGQQCKNDKYIVYIQLSKYGGYVVANVQSQLMYTFAGRPLNAYMIQLTAVEPGIYGLAFTMGKWFLTDNSSTVGRILMISLADPHEILILIKW